MTDQAYHRTTKTIYAVLGTRPEAIKTLPVVCAIEARGAPCTVIFTGQHTTLAEDVFSALHRYPDVRLPTVEGSLSERAGAMLGALGPHLTSGRPRAVIVQGDTLSAFVGAVGGYLCGLDVAHIEAGLRTGNVHDPFPEEGLRRAIAPLARWHLAPGRHARTHLLAEGIAPEAIHVVGNPATDTVRALLGRGAPPPPIGRPYVLLTLHRRESADRHTPLAEAVGRAAARLGLSVLFPRHPHSGISAELPGITALSPLPPSDFLGALLGAVAVLTDSGGVSEEGAYLGVPTLVLRERTEREAEADAGTITLLGTQPDEKTIIRHLSCALATASIHQDRLAHDRLACLLTRPHASPSATIAELLVP